MGTCTPDEDFPCDSDGKESTCSAGDLGLIPGLGRSPREGNGNPLQDSCLENPMDRGPGGLQSMGSQRVGHELATKQRALPSSYLDSLRNPHCT